MRQRIFRLETKHLARRAGVALTQSGDQIWYCFEGRSWVSEGPQRQASRRSSKGARTGGDSGSKDGWVRANMPGRIVKLTAEIGSEVKAGDILVILEAMKMEYTLKSPRSGVVRSVKVKQEELVQLGQELVEIGDSTDAHR